VLNPEHEIRRYKARVFAAALAIRQGDWEYLRDQLQTEVVDAAVTSVRETRWGDLYEIVVAVNGLNDQTRRVTTVWLVAGEEPPRLVTAYVAEEAASA
jgi:hypothetical protein